MNFTRFGPEMKSPNIRIIGSRQAQTTTTYQTWLCLASLRIADTYFAQDQMPNAIEAYRRFIQLHPTHPDVPYAHYRIGLAYYEQLPGDWFFLPPAYEKDLASTGEAEAALARFLERRVALGGGDPRPPAGRGRLAVPGSPVGRSSRPLRALRRHRAPRRSLRVRPRRRGTRRDVGDRPRRARSHRSPTPA